MAGINRLVGTPWHIERFERQEDDPRRHRSRCRHFDKFKKYCYRRNGKCIGSAHCLEYDEVICEEKNQNEKCVKKNLVFSEINEIAIPDKYRTNEDGKGKIHEKFRKKGTKVKHVKYGSGEIVAADAKMMTIRFDSGRETKFDIQLCAENGYVKLI